MKKKIYEIPQEVSGELRTYRVKAKNKETAEIKAIKLAIKELKKGIRKYSSRAISEKTIIKPKRSKKFVAIAIIIFILFSVSTVLAVVYHTEYGSILLDYLNLEDDYNSLQLDYNQKATEYNNLKSRYDTLEENDKSFREEVCVRFGYDDDCQEFITPNDLSVMRATANVLKHSSDGHCSLSDMIAINKWVATNIEYNSDTYILDVRNSYQYPQETLELKRGDCEDHAVLMVSMCKAEGDSAPIWCAYLDITQTDGSIVGHVCVFVDVGDKLYIFEPTGHWHSSIALPEPQALAEYGGNRVVKKIFNENTYHEFNNNQEFFNYF